MKPDKYYIDTNVLVQMITERIFTADVRYILDYSGARIFVSSECVKELISLFQFNKLKLRKGMNLDAVNVLDFIENTLGYEVRFVNKGHLQQLARLEMVEKHTDPSDRLIVAQAIAEKIPLISSDTNFPKYRKYGLDLIYNR